ncbi:tyrosine-type recombinase/integrase [Tautonia rosea]|uniref:tyrosine-type recombinase/integrase n=1 Tax=Tautonia rosea TaxID=2728037 RepID=UPI001475DE35|nr:tyrosine-type recombinase/integrase [Tautonia rosea]
MARTPKPWYWQQRRGWYATIDHRRRLLAADADHGSRAKAKQAADAEFYRIMSERKRDLKAGQPIPVGLLIARFLADVKARAARGEVGARTHSDYVGRLDDFPDIHGHIPAEELKPAVVRRWLEAKATWGPNRRHDAVAVLKTAFRWARNAEMIEKDPLEGMAKPSRKLRRDRVITTEQARTLLGAIRSPVARDYFEFLFLTGCRPSEAAALEARHLDRARRLAILDVHKTKRKTGADRVIPLTDAAFAIVSRLADLHPEGPLFRTPRGRPWNRFAIRQQMMAARVKAGLGAEAVAYGFRHAFATDALERTGDMASVAAVLGHATPDMLNRVYSHLDRRHDHLREFVNRVTTPEPPRVPTASPGQPAGPAPETTPSSTSKPMPSGEGADPGPAPTSPGTPAASDRG